MAKTKMRVYLMDTLEDSDVKALEAIGCNVVRLVESTYVCNVEYFFSCERFITIEGDAHQSHMIDRFFSCGIWMEEIE